MKKKIIITTKVGDRGTSRLFSGEVVSKTSARLEAYGDLDELVSLLGMARYHAKSKRIKSEILELQRVLFMVSSELATTIAKLDKLPKRVDEKFLSDFEKKVQSLYEATPIPHGFVIPGSTLSSCFLDQARAIARRAERKVVKLYEEKEISNEKLLVWMNRLSDYLYLMARFEEEKPTLVKE